MELSKPWQKFFLTFSEIDKLAPAYWKEKHFLAYFCFRFEQHFKQKFSFSFNGPPSKCTEIIFIKKIYSMLNTSNPIMIKSYIDWVFDKKIIPKNLKIRTQGFLITPGLGNEFNFFWQESNKITKSTELPTAALILAKEFEVSAETYGDLGFICEALKQSSAGRDNYQKFIHKLEAIGLDFSPLKDLK